MLAKQSISRSITEMTQVLWDSVRSLRRSPGLVVTIVGVLAIGIGANATILETLDRLLLRPPAHIDKPEQVRRILIDQVPPGLGRRHIEEIISYPDYDHLRGVDGLEAVAAYGVLSRFDNGTVTIGTGEDAEQVRGIFASHEYWRVLGARPPALGRYFDAQDDQVGAEPVAVIGYRLWVERFGGSASAIGELIDFGRGPYTIVGIAAPGLTDLDLQPLDLFVPLQIAGRAEYGQGWTDNPQAFVLRAVARMAPGSIPATIEAQATTRHRVGRAELIERGQYDGAASVVLGSVIWARGPNPNAAVEVSVWLSAVAVALLLIGILNVVNLLLARSIRRSRETSIRLALGVQRRRLIRQLISEGALLGLAGAGAAYYVDRWLGSAVRRVLFPQVAWQEFSTSTDLWVFLAGTSILLSVLAMVPAAYRFTRPEIPISIQGIGAGTPSRVMRLRAALAIAQACLSVILLIGAGLFLRSLQAVESQDLGFAPDGLYVATIVPVPGTLEPSDRQALFLTAADRAIRIEGVQSASVATTSPFRGFYSIAIEVPGLESQPIPPGGGPYVYGVGENYHHTLEIPILEGRGFNAADHEDAARVVVVGERMAREYWPDKSAIGNCIQLTKGGPCATVIGVAADPRRASITPGEETFQYWIPIEMLTTDFLRPNVLLFRTSDPTAVAAVRREMLGLDSRIRYVEVVPFRDMLAPLTQSWRIGATMFTAFGVLALLLAAIGLYSVIAFDVAQRTREIGIRSALGASRRHLVAQIVARGVGMASAGIVIGVAIAAALAPSVEGLLFEISARDGWTFGLVASVLAATAIIGSLLPAGRASRTDPIIALRAE